MAAREASGSGRSREFGSPQGCTARERQEVQRGALSALMRRVREDSVQLTVLPHAHARARARVRVARVGGGRGLRHEAGRTRLGEFLNRRRRRGGGGRGSSVGPDVLPALEGRHDGREPIEARGNWQRGRGRHKEGQSVEGRRAYVGRRGGARLPRVSQAANSVRTQPPLGGGTRTRSRPLTFLLLLLLLLSPPLPHSRCVGPCSFVSD